jgi:membrane protein required for colicin V production
MIIDIIFAVLMVLAIVQGFRRGLIIAVFSFVAIIIGLAAALKLSAAVANHIGHAVKVSEKWLPVISFTLVFLVVVLLVRLGARMLQKTVETVMLGIVNRIGGIILYAAIYITVFSILLFYAQQMNIIKPATIEASRTWSFIQPWGPKAINVLGAAIPFFRDMFKQLEEFFSGISQKI